jgi:hypothetical protein
MSSPLDAAIRIGEEAASRMIAMANRERRLKWWLYRIKFLLKTGRAQSAINTADLALEFLSKREEAEMAQGPPHTWVHALHQVTGLFAIKGARMSSDDRTVVKTILRDVLAEMNDDSNWLFIPPGRGPRPDDSEPFV